MLQIFLDKELKTYFIGGGSFGCSSVFFSVVEMSAVDVTFDSAFVTFRSFFATVDGLKNH